MLDSNSIPTEGNIAASPVVIRFPANATLQVMAQTNAAWRQLVEVQDQSTGRVYILTGQGEGVPMNLENPEDGDFSGFGGSLPGAFSLSRIDDPNEADRVISVVCKYSRSEGGGGFDDYSRVRVRKMPDHGGPVQQWELGAEDGADDDYNDVIIHVMAFPAGMH